MVDRLDTWTAVQAFMSRHCGVVLTGEQAYLLEARLGPVAAALNFPTVHDYVVAACAPGAPPEFATRLIDAMTTHETFFFRDPSLWKFLEHHVLPELLGNVLPARPLRVWSAAASTGQEIYSLAMLLDERWPAVGASAEYFATDVSALSVARGRAGRYTMLEVNRGLTAMRIMRHFQEDGECFRVREALRERVRWGTFNLLGGEAPPAPCDLILCRNVLIYFDGANCARALHCLEKASTRQGFVSVGSSERLAGPPLFPGVYRSNVLREQRTPTSREIHDPSSHA